MYNLIFVDDECGMLDIIRNILPWKEMNIRVIGLCDNAVSALQLMLDEPVDILVTDIKMPVMDGLELIKRTKEMYPYVECIILSGYEEFELARAAIERGVRSYLLKPCLKEELEEKIKLCVSILERENKRKLEYSLPQEITGADSVVHRMRQYVDEHYDMPGLSVQYLADEVLFLTARYIGKRFLKETNMKFSEYLLKVRMEKAMELLKANECPSTEAVADRVGLGNNLKYFYRLFRQYTGMSLREYREVVNGNKID